MKPLIFGASHRVSFFIKPPPNVEEVTVSNNGLRVRANKLHIHHGNSDSEYIIKSFFEVYFEVYYTPRFYDLHPTPPAQRQ
jgi:hypothetical protein